MTRQVFVLAHDAARRNAIEAVRTAPDGYFVEVKPKTRTLEQNARLWCLLDDVSRQVEWHGRRLSPTDWKFIFSSAINKMDVVPNLDNTGFVVLGQSTSKMNVKEMIEMQTLIEAFGAEKGVIWNEPL